MMCQNCQQVIEQLNINIELFFQNLEALSNKKQLSELDKGIICQSLLGYSRQQWDAQQQKWKWTIAGIT